MSKCDLLFSTDICKKFIWSFCYTLKHLKRNYWCSPNAVNSDSMRQFGILFIKNAWQLYHVRIAKVQRWAKKKSIRTRAIQTMIGCQSTYMFYCEPVIFATNKSKRASNNSIDISMHASRALWLARRWNLYFQQKRIMQLFHYIQTIVCTCRINDCVGANIVSWFTLILQQQLLLLLSPSSFYPFVWFYAFWWTERY